MAERLTECIDSHLLDNGEMVKEYSLNSKIKLNHFNAMDVPNAVYDKLGKLEDILEKYDIEDLEQLDIMLFCLSGETKFQLKQLQKLYKKYNIRNVEELAKRLADANTWQKACELARETLKQVMGKPLWIGGNIPTPEVKDSDYFYQQAKKGKE